MMIGPRLDQIARLLGDPSRAAMVSALMDGRQWTGRELARAANVTPPTASAHLQRLVDGAIVRAVTRGRFRYYALAHAGVADAVETMMVLAPPYAAPRHPHARAVDATLRRLRTCYDHLAGQLAVALARAMVARDALRFTDDAATLTPAGIAMFDDLGIALDAPSERRPLCRPCLDWSERRYHLGGRAGTALARHALRAGWVTRIDGTRALDLTARGADALRDAFGVDARTLANDR